MYDHLRRPELATVGEVLTDLSVPRTIDWVRLIQDVGETRGQGAPSIPKIVLWGGCEANAIGLYLAAHTREIETYGNYVAGDLFVRLASAVIANDMVARDPAGFAEEARHLAIPPHMSVLSCFARAPAGTAYVFNCSFDAFQNIPVYRHKRAGWIVHLEPRGMDWIHLDQCSDERLTEILDDHPQLDAAQRARLFEIGSHVAEHYENARPFGEADYVEAMHRLIAHVPAGSKFVIALDHDEVRDDQDRIVKLDEMTRYARAMRRVADRYDHVGVVSFTDVLAGQSEIQPGGGSHYDRQVYLRFADRVIATLGDLAPCAADDRPRPGDAVSGQVLEGV